MMRLSGQAALRTKYDAYIARTEKRIADFRKQVARELMEALMDNIPVWSGKTIRSLAVTTGGSGGNAKEAHPDRGNYAKDGWWKDHIPDWGDTKNMPLGPEPQRARAENIARASVDQAKYDLNAKVSIVSNSYMWDIINDASYRGDQSRNTAIVSAIAIAQIKSKFGGRVK